MSSKQAMRLLALFAVLTLMVGAGVAGAQDGAGIEGVIPCGDTTTCTMSGSVLALRNAGSGNALFGRADGAGSGVFGRGFRGVFGKTYHSTGAGVRAEASGTGYGVLANSSLGTALYIPYAGYHGIHIVNTGFQGVYIENAGLNGVRAHTYGATINTAAIRGENPYWDGTGVRGTGGYGVVGSSSDNTWAGYFFDNIYVGGSCTGCILGYIARNDDSSPLERGDVVAVSGVLDPLEGQTTPVFKVRRAADAQAAIIGVVQARGQAGQSPDGGGVAIKPAEGAAEPDEYLLIVTQGPIQVKAEPGSGIQAGDLVSLGDTGLASLAAPDALTIGRALDVVDPASGLVWVMVDLQ